jgi:uracil-DNA glycosylase
MTGAMSDNLETLKAETAECLKCALGDSRTNLVFGHGNPNADIVFVGEAPGFNEDKQGVPFVGAAGKLLTELLAGIGLSRDDVYIANVLKCRPPGNRDPLPDEIAACKPVLLEQLAIIDPKIVVTLGAHATRTILGRNESISRVHGTVFQAEGYTVFPIYHPAAALYARSTKEFLEEDFRKLKEFLATGVTGEIATEPSVPPAQEKQADGDTTQLGLF